MNIRFVPYKEIDKTKWDSCIAESPNGLIYSTSAYLDKMAANWDAIVAEDYSAVMPLPWRRKFGIKYLYQPAFIQQGGIISREINNELTAGFLSLAFEKFSFAEITLNFSNSPDKNLVDDLQLRNNFILPLNLVSIENLDEYIIKRYRRSEKNNLRYEASDNIEQAVMLYKELYHGRLPAFSDPDFLNFIQYCTLPGTKTVIRHVYNSANELLALALLLQDSKRMYNIISCILPLGKTFLANYYLYYKLVEEFSETGLILDFEGSDISGIAYFYNKFASENQAYPFIKVNRLPAPLKLFKK